MTATAPPAGRRPAVEHALGPFTRARPPAAWVLRVLATLLDSALVASVAFLATGGGPTLAALPVLGKPGGGGGAGWTVGTLLVLGALQAYTGMTPGKRVAGIAVVDDGSGRPIGLPGTMVRWFAHVLDAILLIGYLRAAFRRDGRTFADSLLGTVAVRTTTPEPHPLVARLRTARDTHAPWLRWPRRVTSAVALVLCAAAATMSITASSGGGQQMSEQETSCLSTGDFAPTAVIGSARSFDMDSRLGITRVDVTRWQVAVAWSTGLGIDSSDNPEVGDLRARLTATSPDGRSHSWAESPGATGLDEAGDGFDEVAGDPWISLADEVASAVVTVPEEPTGWTARAELLDDGAVVAECSAPVPAIETDPADLW
ncbi:RDD family protein [Krasilnikoviella flava]|uniref:RDD family protein n=1 Tax=Krasilnikoviella flava TaxID=526729 RepID=A0A1T5K6P0_9MICO|nr:RDD family protein [Krasilnikoviella flava]SKC59293.1 RDD family protein [Krasilnikoviella flava]